MRLMSADVSKSATCEDARGMAFSLLQSQQNNNQRSEFYFCNVLFVLAYVLILTMLLYFLA